MNTGMKQVPTLAELTGAGYDQPADGPGPDRKLIICATPRSSSYYLTKLVYSAQCGLPLEYFHPGVEQRLASRLNVKPGNHDFSSPEYLNALLSARCFDGTFATKLLYMQLRRLCRGGLGNRLFDGAVVVYLTRRDLAAQAISYASASLTDNWFGTSYQTPDKVVPSDKMLTITLKRSIQTLSANEAAFRRFFSSEKIIPIHVFQEDVVDNPHQTVASIATALGRPFKKEDLATATSSLSAYKDHEDLRRRLREDIYPRLEGYSVMRDHAHWTRKLQRKLSHQLGSLITR